MYFVKYGKDYLHDPRIENCILLDLSLDCEENSCGFCEFTIYSSNPMYDKLRERDADNPIEVYDDDILLFTGFIYELGKEFYLDGHVRCKGELDYLNESIVRPYSTLEKGYGITAPTSVNGYFAWLIKQHNEQVKENKQFVVGKNQGSSLDSNNYLWRENTTYPTTIEEITEKLLDNIGGYLVVRNEKGTRYIDYLSDWAGTNAQILDFGVNLTDYTQTDDALEVATYVIPLGAKMSETDYPYNDGYFQTFDTVVNSDKEYYTRADDTYSKCTDLAAFENGVTYYEYNKNNDESELSLTIDGELDGTYGTEGYKKVGDRVYNEAAVSKYGWIGFKYTNQDITLKRNLVEAGAVALRERISPKRTIEIKAVDMHLVNPNIKPIRIGEYVRVRSVPHNLDSYFLCKSIDLDLNNPGNSLYILGTTFDTLTGQQNKKINELNATINKQYERIETESETRSNEVMDAYAQAYNATASAISAQNAANDATERVTVVESQVTTVQQDAIAAAASAGVANALAAQIKSEIDDVKGDAESLRDGIDDQIETKVTTMTADYVSTTDLTNTETTLRSEITQSAAGVETRVEQTYLKQTDFSTAEAALQTSINQNASSIQTVVSDVTVVQTNVTAAQNAADNATSLANAAGSGATTAQQLAAQAQANVSALDSAVSTRFSTVEQTAAGIAVRVGAVETNISHLDVGGRNLYLGTRNFTGNRWNNLSFWDSLDTVVTWEDIKTSELHENCNGYIRFADSKYTYSGTISSTTQNAMAVFNVQAGDIYKVGLQMLTRFRIGFLSALTTGTVVQDLTLDPDDTNGTTVIDQHKEHIVTVPAGCTYMVVGYWSGAAGQWTATWDSMTVAKKVITGAATVNSEYKEYGRTGAWQGIYQQVPVEAGKQYTFSFFAKGDANASAIVYTDWSDTATNPANVEIGAVSTGEYVRYHATFTALANGTISPRVENETADSWLQICALKFEQGNFATDWTPAPEDVESAIEDAKKHATDFLGFGDDGLTIGDLLNGILGNNVNISGAGVKIRNGSTVLALFGDNEIDFDQPVVFTADGILINNGDAYTYLGRNALLYSSSGIYMNADQSVTFSTNMSRQISGAVFVWSYYENGSPQDAKWKQFFVPKNHVINFGGGGIYMSDPYIGMMKYLYVSNGGASGVAANALSGTSNGIAYDNTKYVLRYVVGV